MLHEYIEALFFIFIAEMGDKTQILAMAFATQFAIREVLTGVFIGSFLNHGLAVILGVYLSSVIPMNLVQIIAGLLFISFALWTLKVEEEEGSVDKKKGPILTVALAFFIGELGDKTQLTAITISVNSNYPLNVLLGTVSGMVIVSGVGIYIGYKVGKKVPEGIIKIVSAFVFLAFGLIKLYQSLPDNYLTLNYIIPFVIVLSIIITFMIQPLLKVIKDDKKTTFRKVASELHEMKYQIKKSVDKICLGEHQCGECKDVKCIIGYTKELLKKYLEGGTKPSSINIKDIKITLNKDFNINKTITSLALIINYIIKVPSNEDTREIHIARKMLEKILFNEAIEWNNLNDYKDRIRKKDSSIAKKLEKAININ